MEIVFGGKTMEDSNDYTDMMQWDTVYTVLQLI